MTSTREDRFAAFGSRGDPSDRYYVEELFLVVLPRIPLSLKEKYSAMRDADEDSEMYEKYLDVHTVQLDEFVKIGKRDDDRSDAINFLLPKLSKGTRTPPFTDDMGIYPIVVPLANVTFAGSDRDKRDTLSDIRNILADRKGNPFRDLSETDKRLERLETAFDRTTHLTGHLARAFGGSDQSGVVIDRKVGYDVKVERFNHASDDVKACDAFIKMRFTGHISQAFNVNDDSKKLAIELNHDTYEFWSLLFHRARGTDGLISKSVQSDEFDTEATTLLSIDPVPVAVKAIRKDDSDDDDDDDVVKAMPWAEVSDDASGTSEGTSDPDDDDFECSDYETASDSDDTDTSSDSYS